DEDRSALGRRYDVDYSPVRRERMRAFFDAWQSRLAEIDFSDLSHEAQIDYVLLRNRLTFEQAMLWQEEREEAEMQPLLPFARRLQELQEARRERGDVDARASAQTLAEVLAEVER